MMHEIKTREYVESLENGIPATPSAAPSHGLVTAAGRKAAIAARQKIETAAQSGMQSTGSESSDENAQAERIASDTVQYAAGGVTATGAFAVKHYRRAASRKASQRAAQEARKSAGDTAKAAGGVAGAAPTSEPVQAVSAPVTKNAGAGRQRAMRHAQKTILQAQVMAQEKAKWAAAKSKAAAHFLKNKLKQIMLANQLTLAALAAFACVCLLFILLMLMSGAVASSGMGVFFSNEASGMTMRSVVQALTEEYYGRVADIEAAVPHDFLETEASDGNAFICWPEVLSVYAAQLSESDQAVTLDDEKKDEIRAILNDMNELGYRTYTTTREEEVPIIPVPDEDEADSENPNDSENTEDLPTTETVTITETHLVITITHKTPEEMSTEYSFTAHQQEQLALLRQPQYESMWLQLLGGFASGGQILVPAEGMSLINGYTWPLAIPGSISSGFGYRTDPITGEMAFHNGIDIAAPEGTPVLAAADGIVIVANGADAWGGGYGYYTHVQHADGSVTVYAHCSAICATTGQTVQRGEVIAYVGSTGKSTGNHLHFEVQSYDGVQNPQVTNLL